MNLMPTELQRQVQGTRGNAIAWWILKGGFWILWIPVDRLDIGIA